MYPDFIGIGAQKAGTTWLYQNLRPHPRIWIPWKEIHYFDRKINATSSSLFSRLFGEDRDEYRWGNREIHWAGIDPKSFSLSEIHWLFKYFVRSPGDGWYASLFEPRRGRVAGEITPSYSILDRDAVAHVHELMPEAKIIFMMRNPVERAWSHTAMRLKNKGRSEEDLDQEGFDRRFGRKASRLRTNYLRTLENWSSFFPEERIFVGFLEDIHFHPEELLEAVYGFLGVDSSFLPPVAGEKVHSVSVGKMPARAAVHLARTYRDDLLGLEERFGGYASFWRFCAERLVDDPPKEEMIPYPLWESSLWREWTDSVGNEFQSGPLSSFGSLPKGW